MPLHRLRAALDRAIVGQGDAKQALALAVLAREHALLVGPTGCGKSALAEAFLAASGAQGDCARVAFHRDTRAAELLGETALFRESHARGERLALRTLPGALSRAAHWLLDDLERAPGEALAPLARMLGERVSAQGPLALECAVATALARSQALHVDPLEPALCDRFALQVRLRALADETDSGGARGLLARSASSVAQDSAALSPEERGALQHAAREVSLSDSLREEWRRLWERLASLCASGGASAPSDRVLAAPGLAVLRAHAVLHGRASAERADLRAARFMLALRVPERLQRAAEQIVERSAAGELDPPSTTPRAGRALPSDSRPSERPAAERAALERAVLAPDGAARAHRPEPADVSRLVRALAGRIDRAKAERAPDPGGAPRRRAALERLDDALDAEPSELALYAEASWPGAPTRLRRERRGRGGALVVLRDVSASMEGARTRVAADVVAGVVRACAKRRMRVAYVEFHHDAEPFREEGQLFHRRYRRVLARARLARSEGRTSYEAPLRLALQALGERAERGAHILLITDGVPVAGDPSVRRERRAARELGARIHPVYLGGEAMPSVLRELAAETEGVCFEARRERSGTVLREVAR